jgi:hypothetical protein
MSTYAAYAHAHPKLRDKVLALAYSAIALTLLSLFWLARAPMCERQPMFYLQGTAADCSAELSPNDAETRIALR